MNVVRRFRNGHLVEHTVDGVPQTIADSANASQRMRHAITMTRSAVNALVSAAKNPTLVSDEEKTRRLGICNACPHYIAGRCSKCGCYLKWKTALEAWHCPIGKW